MTTQQSMCRLTIGGCMRPVLEKARLRILIVGGGIAGSTLAALLHQHGEYPVVVERGGKNGASGYVLGLYPLGARVLHGLGMYVRYQEISRKMERYILHNSTGKVLKEFSLTEFNDAYGDIRGVDRGLLLALLRSSIPEENIFYNATVQHIQNNPYGAVVTFSDGSAQEFDLVVGADGIHSDVRTMIFQQKDYAYKTTGWGGWGAWRSLEGFDGATYRELWADGWFVGIYPVHNKLAVFMGGNKSKLLQFTAAEFVEEIRKQLPVGILQSALQSLEGLESAHFWDLEDCRATRWFSKRVVLLGDSATALLPTAGIGASMAMDSASALADELSRTDADYLSLALEKYVKRQKKRAESAQKNARFLARIMFQDSLPASMARNYIVRLYSLKGLLKGVIKIIN
ncbi:FAD-dependent oxidoreductase [Halodesulfovibrio marinisediminis]|uniref:2-polyprenyl-6-methoxyphenol hydroxylase n=1 Tax=Halodesulfovibrio marinisediminis DSM 17456 TaxID=1121457 RepID=A0A1N6IH11_9BACT|nr:NAD(P)/FAD-dependent oxidoreductase [Halodesulfovibrio marinisediminis]SIO31273.1 2-polyprenyl-6-methoxyphenol hydroxylase [Halodesulfovibrio marinisediminis DSM 17456]